jgi:hypothetical protein
MTATVLSTLYDAVVARFEHELAELAPAQPFGWAAPAEQIHGVQRIVWTPGDQGGALGALGPAKYPGQFPRTLATLGELCTVELTALDDSDANNERLQYEAVRNLYDAWWRAVYLEAARLGIGPVAVVSESWAGGPRGRRMGQTIRVVISVSSPLVDAPLTREAVIADRAVTDVEQAGETETLTVEREE